MNAQNAGEAYLMNNENHSKETSAQSEVLLAENLSKSYGPRKALRELSFSLKAGHVLGFLGLAQIFG